MGEPTSTATPSPSPSPAPAPTATPKAGASGKAGAKAGASPSLPQYVVKPFEGLSSIARDHGITIGELAAANPGLLSEQARKNKYFVNPGDKINLPPSAFNAKGQPKVGATGCGPPLDTVCDYVKLVKKVEAAHPDWSADRVLNALRRTAIYDSPRFQNLYGLPEADRLDPVPGKLEAGDIITLRTLSQHGGVTDLTCETGYALDTTGMPVAIGHVLTGMSAGMHHNPDALPTDGVGEAIVMRTPFSPVGDYVDNLYASTIAGDLGQYASILASGKAESVAAADATTSELIGDIDGFLLGSKLKNDTSQLGKQSVSGMLGDYYGCNGAPKPGNTSRFRDFAAVFDKDKMLDQVRRFGTNYNYSEMGGWDGWTTLKSTMDPYYRRSLERFEQLSRSGVTYEIIQQEVLPMFRGWGLF